MKFDSESLPPILNALVTENNGQKLVLEVAVSILKLQYVCSTFESIKLTVYSNIWVRASFVLLLWTVGFFAKTRLTSTNII